MQLCACVQMFVHMCVSVCVSASFGVIYRSACACLCVCARAHMTPNHEKQAEKGEQRAVAGEGQPSHPDENIPFLF